MEEGGRKIPVQVVGPIVDAENEVFCHSTPSVCVSPFVSPVRKFAFLDRTSTPRNWLGR